MNRDERESEERLIAGVKEAGRRIEPIPGARERVWQAARKEIALARAGKGRRRIELFLPIAAAILILCICAVSRLCV